MKSIILKKKILKDDATLFQTNAIYFQDINIMQHFLLSITKNSRTSSVTLTSLFPIGWKLSNIHEV